MICWDLNAPVRMPWIASMAWPWCWSICKQIERKKRIPKAKSDDERIELLEDLEDDAWADDPDDDEVGISDG